jgi:hypothetical protein
MYVERARRDFTRLWLRNSQSGDYCWQNAEEVRLKKLAWRLSNGAAYQSLSVLLTSFPTLHSHQIASASSTIPKPSTALFTLTLILLIPSINMPNSGNSQAAARKTGKGKAPKRPKNAPARGQEARTSKRPAKETPSQTPITTSSTPAAPGLQVLHHGSPETASCSQHASTSRFSPAPTPALSTSASASLSSVFLRVNVNTF